MQYVTAAKTMPKPAMDVTKITMPKKVVSPILDGTTTLFGVVGKVELLIWIVVGACSFVIVFVAFIPWVVKSIIASEVARTVVVAVVAVES